MAGSQMMLLGCSGGGGGGGNGLLTGLNDYWKLEDVNDSVGSNNLTNTGTVTFVAGKILNGANFAGAMYLTHANNASLQNGGASFWFGCWVNFITVPTMSNGATMISKWDITGSQREYTLLCENTAGSPLFKFGVSSDGTASQFVVANNFGAPTTATWYRVDGWLNASNNTLNVSVNNTAETPVSYSSGVLSGTSPFYMGTLNENPTGYRLNGILDEVNFHKRAPSSGDLTLVYNGGAGLPLSSYS